MQIKLFGCCIFVWNYDSVIISSKVIHYYFDCNVDLEKLPCKFEYHTKRALCQVKLRSESNETHIQSRTTHTKWLQWKSQPRNKMMRKLDANALFLKVENFVYLHLEQLFICQQLVQYMAALPGVLYFYVISKYRSVYFVVIEISSDVSNYWAWERINFWKQCHFSVFHHSRNSNADAVNMSFHFKLMLNTLQKLIPIPHTLTHKYIIIEFIHSIPTQTDTAVDSRFRTNHTS